MALSLLPPDVIAQSHCFYLCSSPGGRGRMGVWWLHPGRSPLQVVACQRLTGFQPITLGQPNDPDSSLISHPRHTDHLSPGSDDSTCITWLVFLPFSLPLPASVFVQECLHCISRPSNRHLTQHNPAETLLHTLLAVLHTSYSMAMWSPCSLSSLSP